MFIRIFNLLPTKWFIRCRYHYDSKLSFVPKHRAVKRSDIDCFNHFLRTHSKILVLTGAGISTESGIPDYRSEGVGLYARTNHKPMQYKEFLSSSNARKRYWARNFFGWPRMASLKPNVSHLALARLEHKVGLVTQNVDGLHSAAGSQLVEELHGSARRVVCLACGNITPREELQVKLQELNPEMEFKIGAIRPDGDVDINEDQVHLFQLSDCDVCGGILKPDIVFFGDNVPAARVQKVARMVEWCDSLLVLATSLSVYSAFRIVLQAQSLNKYIFIVNIGPTRGDSLANIKLNVNCSDVFKNIEF